MPAPKAEQDVNPFDFDPSSVPETNVIPENPFAYDPETKQTLIDTTEYDNLHDAKMVKSSTFTPGENRFGALGSFAADVVVSPAVGVSENAADTVKYYLGNALVSVPNAVRGMSSALPQLGALSALSEATGLNKNITTLGQHLANTETLLRMKQKDEERETRFENMGYEMGTLPGAVGKAVSQGVGQAALMAAAPSAKEPYLLATSAEAYRGKMQELAVAGEAPEMLDYARASGSAILNYAVERIGLDAITSYLKPLSERTVRGFAGRAFQGAMGEGTESAIQNIGEQGLDIGFGLKTPDSFDMNAVVMDGVLGMIGGGAGGLAYASAARKKLTSAYQDVLRYNGHEISVEDATDLAEKTLSGVAFDMTQYIRQKAGVEQSKINAVDAYHQALSGRPTTAEGIAPEDIERVANRKRDFDAIVDSVTAARDTFSETAPEVAMKVKNLESEINDSVRAIRRLEKAGDTQAARVLRKQFEKTMAQAGLTEAQAQDLELKVLLGEDTTEAEMTTELKPHILENERVQKRIADKIVATQAKGENLDRDLESVTQRLKDLRTSVRVAVKEGNADIAKALKEELETEKGAAKKERKRIRKSIRKTFGSYREAVNQLARLEAELPDLKKQAANEAVETLQQKYEDLLDYAGDLETWLAEELQTTQDARMEEIDMLTEQYAELEQERKDILNGVAKPEGRIITTAAKVRQIRYAQASTSLRNIMKARKTTKQELAATYNAVKRAIRSTRLPTSTKNQLIADYAKAQSYEDLFGVYPKIQSAIDDALSAEKRRLGEAWLARGIRSLTNSRFAEERAIGREMQKAFMQSGPTKSINSTVDKYVASLNYAMTIGKENTQYAIDLARDLQLFVLQGVAGRQAQAKAEMERRAKTQAIFEKSIKARKAQAKAKKTKKGAAPLVPGAEDVAKPKTEFNLAINDLYRSLRTIGPEVHALFDNSKPHFALVQARIEANNAFEQLVEKAYGLTGSELNKALDNDMIENFILLPAFDYENGTENEDGTKSYPKIEQRVSAATARSIWAMTRNADVRRQITTSKNDTPQMTEEALQAVEQWVNDASNTRHKAIAEGEMSMLEGYARRIQELYANVFPEEYFDPLDSYFMTARIFSGEDLAFVLPSDSIMPDSQQQKKFVGALQKRTGGQLLFKLQPDIINMRKYINTMEHFLAYAQYVKELKQAINDTRGSLTDTFGEAWMSGLNTQIDFLRDGGAVSSLSHMHDNIFNKMYTTVARVLVRAPTQFIKQRMGFFTANVNYAYASEAFSKADEAIVAGKSSDPLMRAILGTKEVQDRYGASENYSLLQTEIGQVTRTHGETARKHYWNRLFNTFPRLGDKHAYLSVAYAKAKELTEKGQHPADAIAAGIVEADTSQTTLDLGRQSMWTIQQAKTGLPVLRSTMALSSATTQIFNRYWTQLTEGMNLYKEGDKKAGVLQMASAIVKWHVLVPVTYGLAASGATDEMKEYLKRIMVGPAGELPLIGGVYNSTYNLFTVMFDKMTEADTENKLTIRSFLESNLLGSVISQVTRQVSDIATAEDEDSNVWVEAAEAGALIFAMTTGIPAQELAKIATTVYDNNSGAEEGAYPWMLALAGYSRNTVKKARGEE